MPNVFRTHYAGELSLARPTGDRLFLCIQSKESL